MAAKKTATEKDLLLKIRALSDYSARTGDYEPIRKILSLLEQAKQALEGAWKALEVPKTPTAKKVRAKGGRSRD
jgi:hypothetical protein